MDCVSFGSVCVGGWGGACFFFPPVCWSFILQAALGSLSAHVLMERQWSVAKQHGRRCRRCTCEIWGRDQSLTAQGFIFNFFFLSFFHPRLPPTRRHLQINVPLYRSGLNRWDGGVRYRSQMSVKMLTQFYLHNRVAQRILSLKKKKKTLLSSWSEVYFLGGRGGGFFFISSGGHRQQSRWWLDGDRLSHTNPNTCTTRSGEGPNTAVTLVLTPF